MAIPTTLSVREAREGLTKLMRQVQEPGGEPVFVGPHRKPEVVIMSIHEYEKLTANQRAIDNTIASARLEGLEVSAREIDLMERVARGEISTEQAVAIALGTDQRASG